MPLLSLDLMILFLFGSNWKIIVSFSEWFIVDRYVVLSVRLFERFIINGNVVLSVRLIITSLWWANSSTHLIVYVGLWLINSLVSVFYSFSNKFSRLNLNWNILGLDSVIEFICLSMFNFYDRWLFLDDLFLVSICNRIEVVRHSLCVDSLIKASLNRRWCHLGLL